MQTKKLELDHRCHFEVTRYEYESIPPDVSLEYVERSSDHWHSDSTTSINLTEEDAGKIIAFLVAAFPCVSIRQMSEFDTPSQSS